MKKLLTLTSTVSALAVLALITACQTATTNQAELTASKKEFLLAQSGFKVVTVATSKQQQAINGLAQYRVSAVKYNGKLYYVFPTATKDKIYVGKQKQFNAYKPSLEAQQAQQQIAGQSLMRPLQTTGPHHVEVQPVGANRMMGV